LRQYVQNHQVRPVDFTFVHSRWPAQVAALPPIRDEVARWLAALDLGPDARDDLVYAVSEAASNVIEHAYRPPTSDSTIELKFWTEPATVCIEVVDHGRWKTPDSDETTRGRGIHMMERLTEYLSIRFDHRGTRILLRHPLNPPTPEPDHPSEPG
jgi:anti-sigma regulatory factor (Ser/Thr protein kinase)